MTMSTARGITPGLSIAIGRVPLPHEFVEVLQEMMVHGVLVRRTPQGEGSRAGFPQAS